MPSFSELSTQVLALKQSSEQLSQMLSTSGQALRENAVAIGTLSAGVSRSGQDASRAVAVASHSALDAAAAMKALGGSCDEYLKSISQ